MAVQHGHPLPSPPPQVGEGIKEGSPANAGDGIRVCGLRRREDWPTRLDAELTAWRMVPFEWGRADCALFVASCLDAMTGSRLWAEWSDRYRSAAGARRMLHRRGFADLLAVADAFWGERIQPRLAQRGDVVAVETPEGPALGLCLGAWSVVKSPTGLDFVAVDKLLTAWRI